MPELHRIQVVTRDDHGKPIDPPALMIDDSEVLYGAPRATNNGWEWTLDFTEGNNDDSP